MCRSQRALLKVLSKADRKPCQSNDSTRQSTAWTDDNERLRVSQSASCTSLAVNSSSSDMRSSLSAENLTSMKQSVAGDLVRTPVKHSVHNQLPASSAASQKHPATTTVRGTHGPREAVRQSRSGRSQRQPVTVAVELLSNWGHERFVGLTEIELLDASERTIDIHPSTDVTISAASPVNNAIDALFNRKCKV